MCLRNSRPAEGFELTGGPQRFANITIVEPNTPTDPKSTNTNRSGLCVIDVLLARALVLVSLDLDYEPTIQLARRLARLGEGSGKP